MQQHILLSSLVLCLSTMICTSTRGGVHAEASSRDLSPSAIDAMEKIINYKKLNQGAMDLATFLGDIKNKQLEITEIAIVYEELMRSQEPIITKNQLKELYESKKTAISSLDCKYTIVSQKEDTLTSKSVRFAMDMDKVFSEISEKDKNAAVISIRRTAFDGAVWRRFESLSKDDLCGEITKISKESVVYAEADFLKYLHLRECPEGYNKLAMYHLIDFLEEPGTMIQEKLISKSGEDYLLITDGVRELLLDVNKGFSVAEFSCYLNSGDICSRKKVFRRVCSDFVDCGNSIWLPQTITDNNFETGELSTTAVSDYMVNGTIDEKLFNKGIFPDGTIVYDAEADVVYTQGFPRAIESQIDDMLTNRFSSPPNENSLENKVSSKLPTSSIARIETPTRPETPKSNNKIFLKLLICALVLVMVFCFAKMIAKRKKNELM